MSSANRGPRGVRAAVACFLAVVAFAFSAFTAEPIPAQEFPVPNRGEYPGPLGSGARGEGVTWVGSVTSQGAGVMGAGLARNAFGVDGTGIKIGIISDSFAKIAGGHSAGIASGNLPGPGNPNGYLTPVNIVQDDLSAARTDEGRAMAEIIHDVAPGAEILFHSAFNNPQSSPGGTIATAITNLKNAGADIIVDDVGWLGAPVYQDGLAAQAASAAFGAGVAYFSAAGNNANNAYEHAYVPIGGGDNTHRFDADANEPAPNSFTNVLNIANVPNNGIVRAVLSWSDPYPSVGGGVVQSDFDLFLVDRVAQTIVAASTADQTTGADPFEFIGFANTSGSTQSYGLLVNLFAGSPNELLKLEVFGPAGVITDDDDTNSPTTSGHNSAVGAVAVAAHSVFNLTAPEPFTSHGPTTILFDTNGNPLPMPDVRNAPQITGPDGGNTSFFGTDLPNDADTFPNFRGTSASAPHIAAVAALLLELANDLGDSLTPTDVYNTLFASTVDIGPPGYDNITGHGRLDAFAALRSLVPEPGAITMSLLAIGLLVSHSGRFRRGG